MSATSAGSTPGIGDPEPAEDPDRGALEPVGEVGEEAQRRAVAPVEVVDDEQQGRVGGEVQRQPVEPVERGEGDVAGRSRLAAELEDRLGGCGGVGEAPFRDPSRSITLDSKSWRTTPKGKSISSSLPRAAETPEIRLDALAADRRAARSCRSPPAPRR